VSWQHDSPGVARREAGAAAMLASDGDRDTAVRALSEAFAQGRLTADEHGERVRAAFRARTWRQLARLTADLPAPAAAGPAAGVPGSPDRCLLGALLICCPPAGLAWLLAARHRERAGQRHPRTVGRPSAGARAGWHAEDR
jgi:hypothetical protein